LGGRQFSDSCGFREGGTLVNAWIIAVKIAGRNSQEKVWGRLTKGNIKNEPTRGSLGVTQRVVVDLARCKNGRYQ